MDSSFFSKFYKHPNTQYACYIPTTNDNWAGSGRVVPIATPSRLLKIIFIPAPFKTLLLNLNIVLLGIEQGGVNTRKNLVRCHP